MRVKLVYKGKVMGEKEVIKRRDSVGFRNTFKHKVIRDKSKDIPRKSKYRNRIVGDGD